MTQPSFVSPHGNPVGVPDSAVRALRASLEGDSVAPGEDGYDAARRVWNAMIDRRPGLVARCRDAADVARCVRFAGEHGVALTVRGGGHNIGGRAMADKALVVDQSLRRDVRVDAERGIVDVTPGVTLGDLDAATQAHGLVVPTGIVSETGVAGLALGGGFGWLSRRWGLTCDHLAAAELVTADGDVLQVDETSHPDLLWALRGSGGGVGVVTSFRFRPRPLAGPVTAGPIVRADLAEAFALYRGRTADAPEELACLLKLGPAPPAPYLPPELHGRPVAMTVPCHSGDPDGGDPDGAGADLAPLRAGSRPAADLATPRPFAELQRMFDAASPKGRRDYWKSEYVDVLDAGVERALLDAAARFPSPFADLKVFHLGGAVARAPADATSAGHRDARFLVVVASAWEDPADDEANVAWVRDAWRRVHARSGRGGYLNFLTSDADAGERAAAHGGVDVDRLERIRRTWDPDGLFAARAPSRLPSSPDLPL